MKYLQNQKLWLLIIFIVGLSLRLVGNNWDQGQHLHPDERFLTMVTNTIQLPISIQQYFDTASSPLNPFNYKDYQFFVYGTLPIFLTKFVVTLTHTDTYGQINLVGRAMSGVTDSLIIIVLFLLTKKFSKKGSLLPSALYAFMVLPLQLSHFYAVDVYLNFFLLLCFYLLVSKKYPLSGLSFGLALACKVSAIYFTPIILLFFIKELLQTKKLIYLLGMGLLFGFFAFVSVRIFQPYSFIGVISPNPKFLQSIKTLESYNDPNSLFPPGVQWISKTKILFPLQNIIFWGIGLPSVVLLAVLLWIQKNKLSRLNFIYLASITWILLLVLYQGSQFATTMRYFLPIYPFVTILFAITDFSTVKKYLPILTILLIAHILYALSFVGIYTRIQSRVQASLWMYENLPEGSRLTNEYWDDPLPLYLPDTSPQIFIGTMVGLYDPDTDPEKWNRLSPIFQNSSYHIMSSNRLWGSIPPSGKYPLTTVWYQQLFDESGSYKKLKEVVSYPGFTLPFLSSCYYFGPTNYPYFTKKNTWFDTDPTCNYPGIYLRDDTAEEAFTVYDHPKVLIYQRVGI